MSEIIESFLREFTRRGYKEVHANLWHGNCLYVNIIGEAPFYYDLNTVYKKRGNSACLVRSSVTVRSGLFLDACDVGIFVCRYREQLREEMGDGQYYHRRAKRPVKHATA